MPTWRKRSVWAPAERGARSGSNANGSYEMSLDELEFIKAMERFKQKTGKVFPAWAEILQVLKTLGYEKRD